MTLTPAQLSIRLAPRVLWQPNSGNSTNVDTVDGFALSFVDKFNAVLINVAKIKCPGVGLSLILIENDTLNAVATRYDSTGKQYIIGLNKGLFACLQDFFYNPDVEKTLRTELSEFAKYDTQTLSRFCCSFSATYILFHEFSHVARGHLEYMSAHGFEEEEIVEVAADQDTKKDRIRYLIECDADTRSGRITAAEVLNQAQNIIGQNPRDGAGRLTEDLCVTAAFAIHSTFRVMESTRKALPRNYPAYDVRSGIVNTQMIRGIDDVSTRGPAYMKQVDANRSVTKGLQLAEIACAIVSLPRLSYNAQQYAQNWIANDAADVDALDAELKKRAPCPW
jgi:hypothetical protein